MAAFKVELRIHPKKKTRVWHRDEFPRQLPHDTKEHKDQNNVIFLAPHPSYHSSLWVKGATSPYGQDPACQVRNKTSRRTRAEVPLMRTVSISSLGNVSHECTATEEGKRHEIFILAVSEQRVVNEREAGFANLAGALANTVAF
ncbi:MAG: hypothetical protein ACUVTR_06525 [Dehalococcoidia bacterium]